MYEIKTSPAEMPLAHRLMEYRTQMREAMRLADIESAKWNKRKAVHMKNHPNGGVEMDFDIKNEIGRAHV